MGLATLVLLVAGVGPVVLEPTVQLRAEDLRCEFRAKPMGIDEPQPRLSWVLVAAPQAQNQRQSAYRVVVTSRRGVLWDTGKVVSSEQNNIEYAGKPLFSGEVCEWKVQVWDGADQPTWSKTSSWEMGLLRPQDWAAQWINDGKVSPKADAEFYQDDPAPRFRKEFDVRGPIVRARLHITGLGYYEPSLNGERVGEQVLDPGWTEVGKRVLTSTFDVTRHLRPGRNCLGVTVGNGWYNPLPLRLFGSFNLREHLTIGRPRLIAQLHVVYPDGTTDKVMTDLSWRVGESPIRRNNVYLGEVVDARLDQPGWDQPGYDDSAWRRPGLAREQLGRLSSQSAPPIRVGATWHAVKVSEPKPGVFIYDCGENFAGWVSLKLRAPAGTEVRLRYGELLYADGMLNPMTSVAGQIKREGVGGPGSPPVAWQEDRFIASGREEVYTPRFTFRGFRYVELTGLSEALPLTSVTAMRLHSDLEDVGAFECSNPLLNQIQTICRRTFLSNVFSVQSDCPHRERLAYGGDIVATSEAFMANFDMAGFYTKAVRDWSDSARSDGMFTDTAPFVGIQYCGVVWAMVHPLLIDQLHQVYGDRRLGLEEYEAARTWLRLAELRYPDGIVADGLSDHESLVPTPSAELVTPFFYQSARLLARTARRLSKTAEAAELDQLVARIQKAYIGRFLDTASGKVGPGTQASQAIALATEIVPAADRAKVFAFLVKDIETRDGRLTTGILGTKFMLDVLSREGRADLAYRIVTQPEFPGWAWMLKNGATTLWEHWAFSDNTFSHNHPMFGSVSQWMMHWLGGIRPDPAAVGFNRVIIEPQAPAGLDWVKSSYRSVRGLIVSNWKRTGSALEYEVTIPPNVTAVVRLPEGATLENDRPLRRKREAGGFAVGSGTYTFAVRTADNGFSRPPPVP